jgi:uncharacterized protein (TIGR04255 family)
VAVHTNAYANYDTFEEHVKVALNAVHRVVNLNLAERIGLRYVNLVRITAHEKWSDYVDVRLLGLEPQSVGVREWTSRGEFLGPTEVGKLLIRCVRSDQPFPQDLMPSTLRYPSPMIGPGEIVTTLDFDHFVEEASPFKVSAVMATLEKLHDCLDRVFIAAVTDKALVKWGREEG